jgi:hypothetical protein
LLSISILSLALIDVAGVVARVDDDKWWHHGWPPVMFTVALVYFIFRCFWTLNLYFMSWTTVCNNLTLRGNLDLNWCLYSGLAFVWVLMHMLILCLNSQVVYRALTWHLTIGWYFTIVNDQGGLVLGDNTVFSWVGCHRVIGVMQITWFTIKLAKNASTLKIRWFVKDNLDREALEGIFGFFQVA